MIVSKYAAAITKDNNEIIKVANAGALLREVKGIAYDSRRVKNGYIFFCKGRNFRPEFTKEACEKGASAVFYEISADADGLAEKFKDCAFLLVSDVRRAMAVCSALHYGYPFERLITVAVTGTKGKTTTVAQISSVLSNVSGFKSAVLSEVVSGDAPRLTTPESPDLHEAAYSALKNGVTHLICEISSQAMAEKRCYGIDFDYACFLNFGRDHVSPSEHKTEEDYFLAKASLFLNSKHSIINADCEKSESIVRLLKKERPSVPITLFSLGNENADFFAQNLKMTAEGCVFDVFGKNGISQSICVSTHGIFNAENALAAYSVCSLLGADKVAIFRGILHLRVDGRYEEIETIDGKVKVIVDYAHNEMSFRAIFEDLRARYGNEYGITAVFGCPGEKAQERRFQLPSVSALYASRAIICEDDSGSEPFEEIKNDILRGFERTPNGYKASVSVIKDRKEAIRHAVINAFENNEKRIIVFLGRGRDSMMRTENGDVECISDLELAKNAISEYNARISLETVFRNVSVNRGKTVTVVAENGSDIAENLAFAISLSLKNGVFCVVACEKETLSEIKDACFSYGTICEEVKAVSAEKIKSLSKRSVLAIYEVKGELIGNGAKLAVSLKSDFLVYLTRCGGILLNGRIHLPRLALSSAELITLGDECAYLPEMVYAARSGVKSCAVLDGREKNSLALHLSGNQVFGTLLS